jgi:hypothetical protein
MEKIVIVTDYSEEENALIQTLQVVFPGCEIEVHAAGDQEKSHYPANPGPRSSSKASAFTYF